jgi:hypothetical protein
MNEAIEAYDTDITDAASIRIGSDLPMEERNALRDDFVNYIKEMCMEGRSVMAIAVAFWMSRVASGMKRAYSDASRRSLRHTQNNCQTQGFSRGNLSWLCLLEPSEIEPNCEIIVGHKIDHVDGRFAKGKNPRRLHLPFSAGDPSGLGVLDRLPQKGPLSHQSPCHLGSLQTVLF